MDKIKKLQERKVGGTRDPPAVYQQKPEYVGHQNVTHMAEYSTNVPKLKSQENIQTPLARKEEPFLSSAVRQAPHDHGERQERALADSKKFINLPAIKSCCSNNSKRCWDTTLHYYTPTHTTHYNTSRMHARTHACAHYTTLHYTHTRSNGILLSVRSIFGEYSNAIYSEYLLQRRPKSHQ